MNIKKTKTIGIRTDEHFLKLLESASKMYNASKSEIIRSAVSRTYGIPVINYETELRRCSRTLGYFTPVHERGTKWDNIEEHIPTISRQAPLIGFMNLAQLKAA